MITRNFSLANAMPIFFLFGDRGQRIEALAEEAVDLALEHALEDRQRVVGRVALGQPVVGEVVFLGGGVAVPGLHQAGVPLREVLREVHRLGRSGFGVRTFR